MANVPAAGRDEPLIVADDPCFEVHHVAAAFDHGRSGREPTGNRRPDESQCNLDAGAVAIGFVDGAHRRLAHRRVDQGEEHRTVDHAVRVEMVGSDVEVGEPDTGLVTRQLHAEKLLEREVAECPTVPSRSESSVPTMSSPAVTEAEAIGALSPIAGWRIRDWRR